MASSPSYSKTTALPDVASGCAAVRECAHAGSVADKSATGCSGAARWRIPGNSEDAGAVARFRG